MKQPYEIYADLLDYPTADWLSRIAEGKCLMNQKPLASAARLLEFLQAVEDLSLATLQERYTQTFDLNPVCNLEIGYHLFGENYKRGVFLAKLRETETPFALGQARQLPDYLPVLLRLLVKLEDAELRGALITECLIPALDLMTAALQKAENFYGSLIAAIAATLKDEAPQANANVEASAWRKSVGLPVLQSHPF
ncbi:MAG: nitrate reductase molybdenum cofactor assembly chaperone [Acidobacteriota bacterium]